MQYFQNTEQLQRKNSKVNSYVKTKPSEYVIFRLNDLVLKFLFLFIRLQLCKLISISSGQKGIVKNPPVSKTWAASSSSNLLHVFGDS